MFNYPDYMKNQMNQIRQHVSQQGLSGTAIIDIQPEAGIIRLKVNTVPPENVGPFINGLIQLLSVVLTAANITFKVHVTEDK